MKKLIILFQKKDKSMANYMKAFNALLDVAEQTGVTPGGYEATAEIAYEVTGNHLTD